MPARLEIRLKPELIDAEGMGINRKASAYFGLNVDGIRVIRVLTIDANLSTDQLEMIRTEIFTNPVTEKSSFLPLVDNFDWIIWVGLRPGVRDPAGSTAVEAIEDLLGIRFNQDESVYTSRIYQIRGDLKKKDVETIAREILTNDIIQQWRIYDIDEWDDTKGIGTNIPRVALNNQPHIGTFPIKSRDELKRLSIERNLALHESDIPVIQEYFLQKDVLLKRKAVASIFPQMLSLSIYHRQGAIIATTIPSGAILDTMIYLPITKR